MQLCPEGSATLFPAHNARCQHQKNLQKFDLSINKRFNRSLLPIAADVSEFEDE
jgi:hypothetical protein